MAARGFHPLPVARVDRLTSDAAAVTFAVPAPLRGEFAFRPGQTLTVRRPGDPSDARRSYSICARVGDAPRIGVREVPGGSVSSWLVRSVRPGDVVEVQPPSGTFTPDLGAAGAHVLIGAGSGITPLLSIASSLLSSGADTSVALLYGNRRADTVMFADEVADLKDAYPARMQLVHVLSREPREIELFSGRLDAVKLGSLLPAVVPDVAGVAGWWLCGPFGMVAGAVDVLRAFGVTQDRIHRELFYVEDSPPPLAGHAEPSFTGEGAEVTVILDGRKTRVTVPGGSRILDAAQRERPDLPFACKGGVCGTCRARLVSGSARMRRNYALEPSEVDAGYVLTCQAVPVSETVTVDYDA